MCDAPAKAYVKAAKSFSGYYGCDKCCIKGKYLGRMTFPNLHGRLRTDHSFANQDQKKHHKGISPLTLVGIPMVTSFPLDYMHLVCLGVVRKLIGYWCKGPLKTRLAYFLIMQASGHLATFRSHIPRDFARKPRALHQYERWKATEFRHFVLYSGPVALKKVLPLGKYRHFLHLHVAIVILSCPSMESFYPYAHHLLFTFVQQCKSIYGEQSLVYNVHCLIHLTEDCCRFGCLDSFSCFPFENYLKELKTFVRSGNRPLQQIYSRIIEQQSCPAVTCSPDSGIEFGVVPSSSHSSVVLLFPILSVAAVSQSSVEKKCNYH